MTVRHAPIAIGLLIWMLAGCGDDNGPGEVLSLAAEGTPQSAPAGALLPEPLRAVVRNVTGDPVRGVQVRFEITQGSGAELSDEVATSGFDGVARVDARLGTALGTYRFSASIGDRDDQTVTFEATATPPPTLTGASQNVVEAGDTITLTGTNFSALPSGNNVFFGVARALVLETGSTSELRVVVPPCIASGSVDVRVEVGSASTGPLTLTYVASSATLGLQPLQGLTVAGTEAGNCLHLGGDGASYLVVPQYATGSVPLQDYQYSLGNEDGTAQSVVAARRSTGSRTSTVADRFHRSLRLMEQRLAPLAAREARARRAEAPSASMTADVAQAAVPALNSTRDFRVLAGFSDDAGYETSTARLKYVGDNILLYVDVDAPAGGFSDDDLERFGRLFDRDLYPLGVQAFGTESDIDDNDRVIMLLTPIVNDWVDANDCSVVVSGFFFGLDLVSRSSDSNKGEIFYGVVPDPSGAFGCQRSLQLVQRLVPTTFIHELQHMISFNQHVLVRGGSSETIWLNEGLSHIAEEIGARYYENKYPPPLGRTDPRQIFPDSAQDFILGDLRDSYTYLEDRTGVSVTTFAPDEGATLAERGAAWLFLRWLGDQKDSTIYRRLVQTSLTSIANVEDKAGESFASLFGDFSISVYTDSLPGVPRDQIPTRFRFKSRNLRRLYQALFDAGAPGVARPFPFELQTLPYDGAVLGGLVPGTMDFFRLQTPNPSAGAAIRFSAPGGAVFDPALNAQVGIFRLP